MLIRHLRLVLVLSLALGLTQGVGASPAAGHPPLEKALQARLDECYGPIWARGDAAAFVREFLTDDAVLTASDGPKVWQGEAQSLELIKDLMKAISSIKAKAVYTRVLGPNAAFQFVSFQITARDPKQQASIGTAKSLYVWIKTQQGWRVAADHYSFAGMDMPH